jgi:hypothetical protein
MLPSLVALADASRSNTAALRVSGSACRSMASRPSEPTTASNRGDRVDHLGRGIAVPALLEAQVVLDADPGQHRHLLATQTRHPAQRVSRRQADLGGRDQLTPGAQEIPESYLPGDPVKVAVRVIESMDQKPAPLRLVLGSDSYRTVTAALRDRLAQVASQETTAASTDF